VRPIVCTCRVSVVSSGLSACTRGINNARVDAEMDVRWRCLQHRPAASHEMCTCDSHTHTHTHVWMLLSTEAQSQTRELSPAPQSRTLLLARVRRAPMISSALLCKAERSSHYLTLLAICESGRRRSDSAAAAAESPKHLSATHAPTLVKGAQWT
jgi:hypothetical protein